MNLNNQPLIVFNYKKKTYIQELYKSFKVPAGTLDEISVLGKSVNNTFTPNANNDISLDFIKIYREKKEKSCKFKRRKRYLKQINFRRSWNIVKLIES